MHISIDCRWLGSSGVGTYLDGCLPILLDSQNNFTLIGDRQKISKYILNSNNIKIIDCNIKPFTVVEFFLFPRNILKEINQADIYYTPYFNIPGGLKIPVFITIHDIIFPDMPDLVSVPGLWARMFFYKHGFSRATLVFTVSDFSKSRIEYHLGKKKQIIVTCNGINSSAAFNPVQKITKKKIILFIGNVKKNKGIKTLLEAYIKCIDDGLEYKLVIIGKKENFRSKDNSIQDYIKRISPDKLIFTGFIPDDEKIRLLQEASLLVQPSLYEGFGIPPLEAMVCGTKALISDIPVFKEIYNEFPVTFFKAGDCEDLKEKLMKLLMKEPETLILSQVLKDKYTYQKAAAVVLSQMETYCLECNHQLSQ
ncbi:MAG: glycosyltransferase family 4 protein [Treponema sp.]|nr:glycosyltransferase family 4 protein [Treponema sp.]